MLGFNHPEKCTRLYRSIPEVYTSISFSIKSVHVNIVLYQKCTRLYRAIPEVYTSISFSIKSVHVYIVLYQNDLLHQAGFPIWSENNQHLPDILFSILTRHSFIALILLKMLEIYYSFTLALFYKQHPNSNSKLQQQ